MNETQRIELIISPEGRISVETKGFAGSSCKSASQYLEQALGKRDHESLTAEFYHQIVDQSQRLIQKAGNPPSTQEKKR